MSYLQIGRKPQYNIGNAYDRLPAANRRENLLKSILCYEAALQIQTEHDSPEEYAMTQYNRGNAYEELSSGKPGRNRRQALVCFEAAVRGFSAVGLTEKVLNAVVRIALLTSPAR